MKTHANLWQLLMYKYYPQENQCRSPPKCYKCGQGHSGDTCNVEEDDYWCCLCKGNHQATSKNVFNLTNKKLSKNLWARVAFHIWKQFILLLACHCDPSVFLICCCILSTKLYYANSHFIYGLKVNLTEEWVCRVFYFIYFRKTFGLIIVYWIKICNSNSR